MLTVALVLAALAYEGDARRVQRVIEPGHGLSLEQQLRLRKPFDLAASQLSKRLLFTRNPAAAWQVAYLRRGPHNSLTQVSRRQINLDKQIKMSDPIATANTQSTAQLDVVEKEYRDQLLTVFLKSDIQEVLRKEPQIQCFAENIKVIDRALGSGGTSLKGLQDILLSLKLLRSMRDRFILKDDIQVLENITDMEEFTRNRFPRTVFTTRWQVRLEGVRPFIFGVWSTQIELDANISVHINEDKQIDLVTIQQVSINGGKPLSSWPNVSLPSAEIASLEAEKDTLIANIKELTAKVDALREVLRESTADRRKSKDEFTDKLEATSQALEIVNKTVLDLSPLLGQGEFGGLVNNTPAQEALNLLHNTFSSFDSTRQAAEEVESSEQLEFEISVEKTKSGIQSKTESKEMAKQSLATVKNKLATAKEFPTIPLELQKIEEWAERVREDLEEQAEEEEKQEKERKAREAEEERQRKEEEKQRQAEERERKAIEAEEERERKLAEAKAEKERKEAEAKALRKELADAKKAEQEEKEEAARKEKEERLALKAEQKEKEEQVKAAKIAAAKEQKRQAKAFALEEKQRRERFKKEQQERKRKLAENSRKQWQTLTADEKKQQKMLEKKQKELARDRLKKWKQLRQKLQKGEKYEEEAASEGKIEEEEAAPEAGIEEAEEVSEEVVEVPAGVAEEDGQEVFQEKVEKDMDMLKADIQNILRLEPHWNLFSKDFKVFGEEDRRELDSLEDSIRLWKLLRRMDGKFTEEDIQVDLGAGIWLFGIKGWAPLKKFTASCSVKFKTGLFRKPTNFELEATFHFDAERKIDYVRVERWLANGQVLQTRPEIDLTAAEAQNVRNIEAWARELPL